MSTQCNTYVLLGASFPYDLFKDHYETFEDYMDSAFEGIEGRNGLTMLYDGMCGSYVAVGRVIAKTEDGQGFGKVIAIDMAKHDPAEVKADIERHIGSVVTLPEFTAGPLVISHYR